jgi:pyruvate-formate lyase-activating enzyme
MHLAELLARRPVPASAVFLALTRRCPLTCAHCSTRSTSGAPQQSAALLERFVGTFSPADHPEFMLLTGGEPLLRPRLVVALAALARAAGTRSYLLTGMFFAAAGATPDPVRDALAAVDHVAVSIDAFHERQVPRRRVFAVLHELLAAGRDVSVQACGTGDDDPYLDELTRQVREEFADRVPLLVTGVAPVGRARDWLPGARATGTPAGPLPAPRPPAAAPCDLVSWPVVGFDGTITACCNQDVLDHAPVPAHLHLGHIASATWPQVRRRTQSSPVLRALRTRGPLQLAHRASASVGSGSGGPRDYCGTCRTLSAVPGAAERIAAEAATPAAALLHEQALALHLHAGPAAFARRHGAASRADLVLLGSPGTAGGTP